MPGESRRARLRALLRRAGAKDVDPSAVIQAFVHPSAARERVDEARLAGGEFASNQRLEFLGDTVLGYAVARYLFAHYPEANEGELALRKAALVSDVVLAQTADRLGFAQLLVLGAGQAQQSGGPVRTMLADSFEAFVAALSEAAGLDVAAAFVEKQHIAKLEREARPLRDPKTLLQEWSHKHLHATPSYTESHDGPAHARTFHATVGIEGEWLGEGFGPSKKEAQRAAAAAALEVLANRGEANGAGARTAKSVS